MQKVLYFKTGEKDMKTKGQMKFKTVDLAYIAICTALMAICSWISIPTVVPFTLQTFAVFIVLELVGGRRGTLAILTYILLASVGVPVLAGFSGGLGSVLGLTGGYILGFIFIGLLYWMSEALIGNMLPIRIITLIAGLLVCYAFGTGWFMVVYTRQSGPISLMTALGWCVFPFIVPDLAKLALAVVLGSRLRRVIRIEN